MEPLPVVYRDENWFIVNKPYDCRIQNYPNTTGATGKKRHVTGI